jgi:hypothetical protein
LAEAIREAGGRPLTREADLFLATVVAECLHERLTLASVVLMVPCLPWGDAHSSGSVVNSSG